MGKIVFVGHSVPKGTDYGGVTRVDTFGYKIGIANGYADSDIYIRGIGSETSAGLLARTQADVIDLDPDVCVAMTGANDWGTGVSVATFKANLLAFGQMVLAAGIKLVLFTDNMIRGDLNTFVNVDKYENATRDVARALNCPVIDIYSRMCYNALCGSYTQYYAGGTDVIHLSVLGHTWVAGIAAQASPQSAFKKVV